MNPFWYNISVLITAIIPAMITIYLVFLVRKCHDNLCIHTEFKYLAVVLCSYIIFYILVALPFKIGSIFRIFTLTFILSFHCFAVCALFTCMPLYWYRVLAGKKNRRRKISAEDRWSLVQVLESRDGFEMFAEYLVKEFAIEVTVNIHEFND